MSKCAIRGEQQHFDWKAHGCRTQAAATPPVLAGTDCGDGESLADDNASTSAPTVSEDTDPRIQERLAQIVMRQDREISRLQGELAALRSGNTCEDLSDLARVGGRGGLLQAKRELRDKLQAELEILTWPTGRPANAEAKPRAGGVPGGRQQPPVQPSPSQRRLRSLASALPEAHAARQVGPGSGLSSAAGKWMPKAPSRGTGAPPPPASLGGHSQPSRSSPLLAGASPVRSRPSLSGARQRQEVSGSASTGQLAYKFSPRSCSPGPRSTISSASSTRRPAPTATPRSARSVSPPNGGGARTNALSPQPLLRNMHRFGTASRGLLPEVPEGAVSFKFTARSVSPPPSGARTPRTAGSRCGSPRPGGSASASQEQLVDRPRSGSRGAGMLEQEQRAGSPRAGASASREGRFGSPLAGGMKQQTATRRRRDEVGSPRSHGARVEVPPSPYSTRGGPTAHAVEHATLAHALRPPTSPAHKASPLSQAQPLTPRRENALARSPLTLASGTSPYNFGAGPLLLQATSVAATYPCVAPCSAGCAAACAAGACAGGCVAMACASPRALVSQVGATALALGGRGATSPPRQGSPGNPASHASLPPPSLAPAPLAFSQPQQRYWPGARAHASPPAPLLPAGAPPPMVQGTWAFSQGVSGRAH